MDLKNKTGKLNITNRKSYKAIGYWYEKDNPDFPDPAWFIDNDYSSSEKEFVINYLNKGKPINYYRGGSDCRICGELTPGTSDLTDGYYVFPSGLIHYIEKHNLRLPSDFIDKIRKSNKKSENDDDLIDESFNALFSFDWWTRQRGEDDSKSSKKNSNESKKITEYIYKDGTKKIENDEMIKMIFPDGRVQVFKK